MEPLYVTSTCPLCDEVISLQVPHYVHRTREGLVATAKAMWSIHIEEHVDEIELWVNTANA